MKKKKSRKNKKWKRYFAILIIIGMIMLLPTFLKKATEKPEKVLMTYMSYVLDRKYEEMYELLSEETKNQVEKEIYLARNKNIYEGIEISDLQLNIVKTNKKAEQVEIIYQVKMQTIAGEISFFNTSYLKKEGNDYYLKWTSSDIFPELKDNYKVRVETIEANRGKILDRNGIILAGKQMASEVGIVLGKFDIQTKDKDIQKIANLLELSVEEINYKLSASYVKEDTFIPLKTIRKSEQTRKNQLLEIKGVKIIDVEERIYPFGEATSHLLGYVQGITKEELKEKQAQGYREQSKIGKLGIEKIYEERLRAIDGVEIVILDNDGKKRKTVAKKEAKNGEDIKLTIDSSIQNQLYEQWKEDKSASIVLNDKTGEILAFVSTPSFDSNDFSLGMTNNKWESLSQAEDKPLYNRLLASYPPGSSFKPITGAIGLKVGAFTAEEDFGKSGKRWQKDASWKDFYITTLATYSETANLQNALIYSDNIYFAKAALKIGKEKFVQNLKELFFNEALETPVGTVKSIYSNGDTITSEVALANSGYGQAELLVNPIHMAMLYSTFANGGNMIETQIEYKDRQDTKSLKENVFEEEVTNTIKEALIQVVENPNGTAHSAKIEGIWMAGKTGTAEIKATKEDKEGKEIGWYNTFVVDEKNRIPLVMVTVVENVEKKGGSHYVVDKTKGIIDKINIK